MSLLPARLSRAALFVACVLASPMACSSSDSQNSQQTVTQPPPPRPPKPTIVLSSDSLGATLIAGAPKSTQSIEITAGTTTALAAVTVADVSVASGQPTTWISATLSAQTAPATLMVTIDPNVPAGTYSATIHVSATDAETKSVRVSLTVKPRPRLVVDTVALGLSGDLGAAIAARTIHVTSVEGAVDSIAVSKLDCGGAAPAWLAATLSGPTTPATVKLETTPGALKAGSYTCTFVLSTSQTLVDSASQTVRVSLALRAVPRIAISVDTLRIGAFRQQDGQPSTVSVTNAGSGTLDGLSVARIDCGSGPSGWLTTSFDSTTAPATLTVTPSARSLGPSTYNASIVLASSAAGVTNSPIAVPVRFMVSPIPTTGISVTPNPMRLTVKSGTSFNMKFTITATGDTPAAQMGFALPSSPGPFYFSLGCTGSAAQFTTPCILQVDGMAPGPGTYTASMTLRSYASGFTAVATFILTSTP